MKLNHLCMAGIGLAIGWANTYVALAQSGGAVKWVTFDDCPVLLEHSCVVSAKESGTVESVAVTRNEAVTKGQLLLSLDKDEAEGELDMAKASQAVANHLAADDNDLKFAKLALEAAEEELASSSEIAKSISGTELRRQTVTVGKARLEVVKAQNALERLGIQSKLAAKVVKARSIKLANRDVNAPSEGIVTELLVGLGESVEVGKPVMVIADYRQLQVDCLIPIEKADLKKLNGLEVRIESNQRDASGTPVRLRGKISSYDPKLNAQGEVRVHCSIQNQQIQGHWQLLPGMNVRLEVGVPAPAGNDKPPLISRRPR